MGAWTVVGTSLRSMGACRARMNLTLLSVALVEASGGSTGRCVSAESGSAGSRGNRCVLYSASMAAQPWWRGLSIEGRFESAQAVTTAHRSASGARICGFGFGWG